MSENKKSFAFTRSCEYVKNGEKFNKQDYKTKGSMIVDSDYMKETMIINLKDLLDNLTNKERYNLIHSYCIGCGGKDVKCTCMKDK